MEITKVIGLSLRQISKIRFRVFGLATIKNIPTVEFGNLIKALIADGWQKGWLYKGFDAWIDYGKVILRKRLSKLTFEWDNWTEGSVEGPKEIIESIAKKYGYEVSYEWRWAEYDSKRAD